MRKSLGLIMAAVVLAGLGVGIASGADKPVNVRAGNLDLTFNGGFSPTALPKNELAPIALKASGNIATVDGTHPPALREFVLETDKNGAVDVEGYPTCRSGQLQSQSSENAEKVCRDAIIGRGTTVAEVALAEQPPILVNSDLLVFNGGEKGGVTTFYIHAFFTAPVSGAIVTTVKISKIRKGRFGTRAVASIPVIAGGSGSVKSFSLTINKRFTHKGQRKSILLAKCPDGRLQAHGTAVFADGTDVSAEIIRTCSGKN